MVMMNMLKRLLLGCRCKGVEYAIPASRILSVTTSDAAVASVSATKLADVAIDAQDNQWVVTGEDITAGTDANKTAVITVQVNTQSGVKVLTKEVTVSKAAPKAQELRFVSVVATAANPYALPTVQTDVTSLTFSNQAAIQLGTIHPSNERPIWSIWNSC